MIHSSWYSGVISVRQVFSFGRIDAEFCLSKLKSSPPKTSVAWTPLGTLCEFIQCGPAGKTVDASSYVSEGIPLVRPSNLEGGLCDEGLLESVPPALISIQKLKLYGKDDILVSRIGEVKCGIITSSLAPVAISSNLMALRVKHTYIDPYYLLSFLLSSVGQDQLRNSSKHVSLSRLDTHSLAAIEVPLLPYSIQQRIGKLVREAVAKKLRSRVLLQQALSVFPQCVSQVSSPSSLTVPFDTTLRIKRLDAEYYWLSSQAVSHQYNKEPISVPLGEIASFVRGIEVGSTSYTTQGNLFIRVGNITPFGLIWKSQKHITATLYKKLTRTYTPHAAEILLVKDGKPGVCCVLGKEIAGILSEGIIRVQVAKFDPYYIAACLQSDFCRRQIAQSIDGTLVPHLKLETIKCLQIPILSPEEQGIVGDLMQNMYKAFEASKSLWEKAFQFVEGRDG